jgi:hypothetical protein
MAPINFTLKNRRQLTAIPNTRTHMDGHPVLSLDYKIYRDGDLPQNKDDNDYLGLVTFEVPGRIFNYTPNGDRSLSPEEVEEVIEYLSDIRDNPQNWQLPEG